MTAYVIEATRFKVVISHQQQGFAGQFHREVIPRLGQLIAVSDYLPCAMKDLLSFVLIRFGIEIEARRQGPGSRDLGIDE